MAKWEYIFIQSEVVPIGGGVYVVSPDGERKKLSGSDREGTYTIKLLNHYGASGWEMTGVESRMVAATAHTTVWTLKRLVTTTIKD